MTGTTPISNPGGDSYLFKSSVWTIGSYSSNRDSVCVNLDFGGKRFHRHDYGGILPRAVRIGIFIEQLEKESGCRDHDEAYCNAVIAGLRSGHGPND